MTAAPTISAKAKERPILFSSAMVKAILAGTKSQTRRAMKPQPEFEFHGQPFWRAHEMGELPFPVKVEECPYGQPGDVLYCKETWRILARLGTEYAVSYRATEDDPATAIDVGWEGPTPKLDAKIHEDKWTPSIFMPRWASRLTLEIVAVRVERLAAISEEDAVAEGVESAMMGMLPNSPAKDKVKVWRNYNGPMSVVSAQASYRTLWESINGPGSWEADPFCWVLEFKRLTP